jgi:hypothetical protein
MEVILKEDVNKLGQRGDVVKVADGYGRNFLLPKKLAMEATAANKVVIEQMKQAAVRRSRAKNPRPNYWSRSSTRWSWFSSARWARTIISLVPSPRPRSRISSSRRVSPSTAASCSWKSRCASWANCPSSAEVKSPCIAEVTGARQGHVKSWAEGAISPAGRLKPSTQCWV